MKRLLLRCLASISLLFYYNISEGAIFTIANGNVAGLISAMETARDNGDVENTINLATNGLYVFTQMYEVVSSGGKDLGATALPRAGTNKTLIINGNGSIFRRSTTAPTFRFFFARQNTTLKLNNLNLENGQINSSEAGGGAVYVHYQTVFEAKNCKFISNKSLLKFGGAIYVNSQNSVLLDNCEFRDNQTYRHGGAVYNVLSDLTIQNCYFKNNSTTAPTGRASGGGLYVDGGRVEGNTGFITIQDSRFEGNQANPTSLESNEGGGLYVYGYNNNTILVERCSILDNQTKGYGGGMILDNESIDDIKPNNVKITVRDCLIANNKALTSQGGGIYMGGVQVQEPAGSTANTKLINCTIVNNKSGSYGGGITNSLKGAEIMNCTIAYNEAEKGGGGIYYKEGDINLRNSIIAYNKVGTASDNSANCRMSYQGSNNIQYPLLGNAPLCTAGTIVADPKLGPLQDNGGSTMTMALLAGSPAIDAGGSFSLTPNTDQRGVVIAGTKRDIGAFEASNKSVNTTTKTNSPPTTLAIKVNFQDNTISVPTGYLKDIGQAYGVRKGSDQGTGKYSYGWVNSSNGKPIDLSSMVRTRNNTGLDAKLNSFIHMNHPTQSNPRGIWEIALPNGNYKVIVSVGDPTVGKDAEIHRIDVEGVNVINNFAPNNKANSQGRFKVGTLNNLTVKDGKLTLSDSNGGVNTKLNYVEIIPLNSSFK